LTSIYFSDGWVETTKQFLLKHLNIQLVFGEAVMISALFGGEFDFDVGLHGVPWVMTR